MCVTWKITCFYAKTVLRARVLNDWKTLFFNVLWFSSHTMVCMSPCILRSRSHRGSYVWVGFCFFLYELYKRLTHNYPTIDNNFAMGKQTLIVERAFILKLSAEGYSFSWPHWICQSESAHIVLSNYTASKHLVLLLHHRILICIIPNHTALRCRNVWNPRKVVTV